MARSGGRWDRLLKRSVGSLFAPAPDPRAAYADPAERPQILLAEVLRALAELNAAHPRLRAKAERIAAQAAGLEEGARTALRGGREDIARVTLQQMLTAQAAVAELEAQSAEIEAEAGKLTVVEQRLRVQIDAIAARRQVLQARYSAAEAQVKIGEALAGISGELADLGGELERAERRTTRMQARAAALDEMAAEGLLPQAGPGSLAGARGAIARLGDEQVITARLDQLKRELEGNG